MIDLEGALIDLGEHLDAPAGDELIERMVEQLRTAPPPARVIPWPRHRSLLVAAAVVVTLAVSLVSIAPAREAIAHWLGIGAVEVRNEPTPTPSPRGSNPVPGEPGSTPARPDLAAAQQRVEFTIRVPHADGVAAPVGVVVDDRVPGGLVAISYGDFTLVELASAGGGDVAVVGKLLGPEAQVQHVTIHGRDALWISGNLHTIGYLDRNHDVAQDTVRQAGDVLLWANDGVTYRIEGLPSLADAQRIADSIS